eukprot:PhF_6_TR26974/c0_g3_i6/m.39359
MATKERLETFFRKYNPDKLASIPKIMEQYAGKEDEMFAALVAKYGPEPNVSREDPKTRLIRVFQKYNPEKLSTVDEILKKYAGKENELFEALVAKYGPEPPAST